MKCQNCQSERIIDILAHSSDSNGFSMNGVEKEGYLPPIKGICGGDDVETAICLECGQVQGSFPQPTPVCFQKD